jgi:hypothetical protein
MAGGKFVHLSTPWGSVTSPVNTLGDDSFKDSPNLFAFDERQNFTLTSNLTTQVGETLVLAGTVINSDLVTFEPGIGLSLTGHVDFAARVLGIITSHASMGASNFLGDPGITYLDPGDIGLEPGDFVTIDSSNPNQIDWDTRASIPGDSVRIITAAIAAVPEPAALLLFGTVLVLVGRKLRSRPER